MHAHRWLAMFLSVSLLVACAAPLPLPINVHPAEYAPDQARPARDVGHGRGPDTTSFETTMALAAIDEDPGVRALKARSRRDFLGVSWGVGPSITFDTGSHDRVSEASLDSNGVVRVDDVDNNLVRVTLETHYFFQTKGKFLNAEQDMWGWGPFVAVQPSGTEIIDALGFGMMLGFRYAEESPASFNMGLGWMIDPNAKVLGDGIQENHPLPSGETAIRFQERSQSGVLVMFSFSF